MPHISVILTAYNRAQWMKEAVDSVLRQTYQDFELLIMEDNSPDERVSQVLEEYSSNPKVEIYYSNVEEEDRYKTARYATLINKAVNDMSSGKFLTYLADDDFYYPYRLEVMLNSYDFWKTEKPEEDVHIIYGEQEMIGQTGTRKRRSHQGILEDAWNKVDHNSVLHTRESFDDVGGWDDAPERWKAADAYFWRRLTNRGYKFFPVNTTDRPTDAKRLHDQSVQALINRGKLVRNE